MSDDHKLELSDWQKKDIQKYEKKWKIKITFSNEQDHINTLVDGEFFAWVPGIVFATEQFEFCDAIGINPKQLIIRRKKREQSM